MLHRHRLALVAPLCIAVLVASLLGAGQSQVLCLRSDGEIVVERGDGQSRCIAASDHDLACGAEAEPQEDPCGDDEGNCIDLSQKNLECDRPETASKIDGMGVSGLITDLIASPAFSDSSLQSTEHFQFDRAGPAGLRADLASLRAVILLN
jgi:hypothetical protein